MCPDRLNLLTPASQLGNKAGDKTKSVCVCQLIHAVSTVCRRRVCVCGHQRGCGASVPHGHVLQVTAIPSNMAIFRTAPLMIACGQQFCQYECHGCRFMYQRSHRILFRGRCRSSASVCGVVAINSIDIPSFLPTYPWRYPGDSWELCVHGSRLRRIPVSRASVGGACEHALHELSCGDLPSLDTLPT